MSIQHKAVFVLDERRHHAVVSSLRAAVAKIGLKQSLCTTHLTDISNLVYSSQWPVVFVIHDPECADGIRQFERIFRSPGAQLFHYFLLLTEPDSVLEQCHQALGLSGVIRTPIDAHEMSKTVSPVLFKSTDVNLSYVHGYALSMLKKEFLQAESHLKTLKRQKVFTDRLELARVFIHDAQNEHKKVMSAFQRLKAQDANKLRVLSDYAYFLSRYSIHDDYVSTLDHIRTQRPEFREKLWEQIEIYAALEKYNELGQLLQSPEELQKARAEADLLFSRIMLFMGLEQHIPSLLSDYPEELSVYQRYKQSENTQS